MIKHNFGASHWKEYIPIPVYEEHPEYLDFYIKAWELAFSHVKDVSGMPQTPYMDEAFCETQVWIWDVLKFIPWTLLSLKGKGAEYGM